MIKEPFLSLLCGFCAGVSGTLISVIGICVLCSALGGQSLPYLSSGLLGIAILGFLGIMIFGFGIWVYLRLRAFFNRKYKPQHQAWVEGGAAFSMPIVVLTLVLISWIY